MDSSHNTTHHRLLWSECLTLWETFARKSLDEAATEFENLCLEMTVTATFTRQSELLETIQLVKGCKKAAAEALSHDLLAVTDGYVNGTYEALEATSDNKLQLLEDHRLETSIATSNWVRKVYTKLDDKIWPAVGRLLSLAEGDNQHYLQRDIAVPFAPQTFALTLDSALEQMELPDSENIRFIKTYGSCLADSIEQLYDALNSLLDKADIEIPPRPSSGNAVDTAQPTETDAATPGDSSGFEATAINPPYPASHPYGQFQQGQWYPQPPAPPMGVTPTEQPVPGNVPPAQQEGAHPQQQPASQAPLQESSQWLSQHGDQNGSAAVQGTSPSPTTTDTAMPDTPMPSSAQPSATATDHVDTHPDSGTADSAATGQAGAEEHAPPSPETTTGSNTLDESASTNSSLLNSLINTLESESQANTGSPTAQPATAAPAMNTINGTPCFGISRTAQPSASSCIASDYVSALSNTQVAALEHVKTAERNDNLVEENEAAFFHSLDQMAEQTGRNQITETDMDFINMVGLLFKFVLDDDEIPDKVKNLLSYLHTPYLKLSLIDQGFFANTHHPARVMLNTLARAASRWQEDWRIYARIEEAVNTVLSEFEQDTTVFERVNDQFTHFEHHLKERSDKAEQRSLEAMRNAERHEKARQQSTDDLRHTIGDRPVPEELVEFVFGLWLEVIVFNRLNFGEESEEYRHCLPPIDFLAHHVQPGHGKTDMNVDDAARYNRERQATLKLIAEILKTGGVSLLEAQQHLSSLRQLLQKAFEGSRLDCARLQRQEDNADQRLLEGKLQAQAKHLAQTPFGTWFEFIEDNQPLQLKLVWRSPITQTCMFVNHIGVKARVISIADLATLMADQRCRVIEQDQRSFFERALKSIIRKLQLHKSETPDALPA